ncbi:MAG: 1-deoxy-D-xylulose-5-phosphate synthase [Cellulomonadaceae bacterium]|nr:1-deoxy-D-xylulose-5-phosphate synthase [Cellulomonadaceae bacterium]
MSGPDDLKRLSASQLPGLAEEIRDFLVDSVSRTGGHLGPNLGVVELTIALHRVFDSPHDAIVFDTGHQAYVHKLLTGRHDFSDLRRSGGLSGYPSRNESDHDVVENSHASAALSWVDGIAKARQLRAKTATPTGADGAGGAGHTRRDKPGYTVAVVGDGSLTGGMAWEALNNIAASDRRLVIVVNDNGRSYSPTIGGLANRLDTLRTTREYEQIIGWGERTLLRMGKPGRFVYQWLKGLRKGLKEAIQPQGMFEDLGLKYIGPVNGHDEQALEHALGRAKAYGAPVIVHAITEKGRGYAPAEAHEADRFHAVGRIHPETGLPVVPSRFGWTSVFADEIVAIGRDRDDVVAITAAMLEPVGLAPFAAEFPQRTFDVGIAEQHAATSAAGMAFEGLHPVIALYATFLNRAFDQVLMDVALHRAGVTFVLDRAGITGDDGASHNGMWDMAMLRIVPGLRLAAPRDEASLRAALRQAVTVDDAPTVVRYPKGELPAPIPALDGEAAGSADIDVVYRSGDGDGSDVTRLLIVGIGSMVPAAIEAAQALAVDGTDSAASAGWADGGLAVTVVSPTWVLPIPASLTAMTSDYDLVVTVEDGLVDGGVGAMLAQRATASGIRTPIRSLGLPTAFLPHASRDHIAAQAGLTPDGIAATVRAAL